MWGMPMAANDQCILASEGGETTDQPPELGTTQLQERAIQRRVCLCWNGEAIISLWSNGNHGFVDDSEEEDSGGGDSANDSKRVS
jgi:hypothetical protein